MAWSGTIVLKRSDFEHVRQISASVLNGMATELY